MFIALTILNDLFKTYLDSLKKDLGQAGFGMILMLALLSWSGVLIVIWLTLAHQFQMPSDPKFYIYYIALISLTEISFALFLLGLINSSFFAANSLSNITFAITALYAAIFLGEKYTFTQIIAIAITTYGVLLFFKKKSNRDPGSPNNLSKNKGALLILVSLFITPIEYILYKAASLHTGSYHQFLSGRVTMDFVLFTLFWLIFSVLWYHKNPFRETAKFFRTFSGTAFIAGTAGAELLESWLIYKLPIALFTLLGTVSIPAGYFVGRKKYKETLDWRHVCGATLIAIGIILFIFKGGKVLD